MNKSIKVGELEIPEDYWSMSHNEKRALCLIIAEAIITVLDEQVSNRIPRMDILERLLQSSIQTNDLDENYEVCQVLTDIQKIINE
jgi:hypothetical protein